MGAFLLSVKDERVGNVYSKFHIIPVIFEFLVELAIKGGDKYERTLRKSLKWAKVSFLWTLWILPLFDMATIPLVSRNFSSCPFHEP